jgi:FkbM family methyltransferase
MSNTASNMARGIWDRLTGKHPGSKVSGIPWMKEKILKHQDDTAVRKIRLDHLMVYYKRPYELLHAYKAIFDQGIYRFAAGTDRPTIIDCGANIGMSVMYFKSLYPVANIIAYEPDETNFDLLQKNVTANSLQSIDLHREAVWIKNGTILFDANESEASRISENKKDAREVTCIRLADELEKHPLIDFLKIDIEGAEYEVMKDCAPFLNRVQNMFLEYHGKTDETEKLDVILRIMRDNRFSVYVQNAADTLHHPFVNKTTTTPYDVQLNLYCYR